MTNIPKVMGLKGKDLELGNVEETEKCVLEKLREGWVVFSGDRGQIKEVEDTIYTPGTDRNNDFILIMGRMIPEEEEVSHIFMGKKTPLLKMLFKDIKNEQFEFLTWISISEERTVMYHPYSGSSVDLGHKGYKWECRFRKEEDTTFLEDLSDDIVKNILKMDKGKEKSY